MKLAIFNRKLTPDEAETTTADPIAVLSELLDAKFPDKLPEERDRQLLEAIAPMAVIALRKLRRQRILNVAQALPLQELSDGITTATDALRAELAKHDTVAERIEKLKIDALAMDTASDSNPLAAATIRGEVASLENWICKSAPLKQAVENLCGAIESATRALLPVARHVDFKGQIARIIGGWESRHPSIINRPLLERASETLELADRAMAQLTALANGNVPIAPRGTNLTGREMVNIIGVQFELPTDE